MQNKRSLYTVFNDTKTLLQSRDFAATVAANRAATLLCVEEFCSWRHRPRFSGKVVIWDQSPIMCANKVHKDGKTAVLNNADALNPEKSINQSQDNVEAELCSFTTLYPCLIEGENASRFYDMNGRMNSHLYTDRVLYSRGIQVIKDIRTGNLLPKEDRYSIDVLTVAAPYSVSGKTDQDEIEKIYVSRIKNLMDIAIEENVKYIILNAFLAGNNSAALTARAFHKAIEDNHFTDQFEEIIIALPDYEQQLIFAKEFNIVRNPIPQFAKEPAVSKVKEELKQEPVAKEINNGQRKMAAQQVEELKTTPLPNATPIMPEPKAAFVSPLPLMDEYTEQSDQAENLSFESIAEEINKPSDIDSKTIEGQDLSQEMKDTEELPIDEQAIPESEQPFVEPESIHEEPDNLLVEEQSEAEQPKEKDIDSLNDTSIKEIAEEPEPANQDFSNEQSDQVTEEKAENLSESVEEMSESIGIDHLTNESQDFAHEKDAEELPIDEQTLPVHAEPDDLLTEELSEAEQPKEIDPLNDPSTLLILSVEQEEDEEKHAEAKPVDDIKDWNHKAIKKEEFIKTEEIPAMPSNSWFTLANEAPEQTLQRTLSSFRVLNIITENKARNEYACVDILTSKPCVKREYNTSLLKDHGEQLYSRLEFYSSLKHSSFPEYLFLEKRENEIIEVIKEDPISCLLYEKAGTVTNSQAENYLYQIASGLNYLYHKDNGYYHRNVDPYAFYVTENDEIQFNDLKMNYNNTQTFVSKEHRLFSKDANDPFMNDLYSLGATIFYILERQYYSDDLIQSIFDNAVSETRIYRMIYLCCRKEEQLRYSSYEQLLQSIEKGL